MFAQGNNIVKQCSNSFTVVVKQFSFRCVAIGRINNDYLPPIGPNYRTLVATTDVQTIRLKVKCKTFRNSPANNINCSNSHIFYISNDIQL